MTRTKLGLNKNLHLNQLYDSIFEDLPSQGGSKWKRRVEQGVVSGTVTHPRNSPKKPPHLMSGQLGQNFKWKLYNPFTRDREESGTLVYVLPQKNLVRDNK